MIIDIYIIGSRPAQFREYEKRLLEIGECDYSLYNSTFNRHEYHFPEQDVLVRMLTLPPLDWFDDDTNCPDYYYVNNELASSVLEFVLEGRRPIRLKMFNDISKILDGEKE